MELTVADMLSGEVESWPGRVDIDQERGVLADLTRAHLRRSSLRHDSGWCDTCAQVWPCEVACVLPMLEHAHNEISRLRKLVPMVDQLVADKLALERHARRGLLNRWFGAGS